MMNNSHSESYAAAGVDITAGYKAVKLMKHSVERTQIPGVVSGIGGFGGLFAPNLAGMEKPILVSGTDGVGTKLKLAQLLDRHDTVGIDCVAMCVNDIICCGAKPLFFLDYIAIGKNIPEKVASIVSGVAEGCVQSGCALLGGETAEHPGVMAPEDYDLAGFAVGLVDEKDILDGRDLREGDVLLGLASSGVHSNGFSLVRKVLDITSRQVLEENIPELGCTLGDELLRPTRIYVKALRRLHCRGIRIKAASHITGGGLYENVPRMMVPGLTAAIRVDNIPAAPIFHLIAQRGNIPERDMYNTFNMGVGMVIAIPKDQVGDALDVLVQAGERASVIGTVVRGDAGVELL